MQICPRLEHDPLLKCSRLRRRHISTGGGGWIFFLLLHLMCSSGAWEPHRRKPPLIPLGVRGRCLIFKGNLIRDSGSACQCSSASARQPVSNIYQDFDLRLTLSPHLPVGDPRLPCHRVNLTNLKAFFLNVKFFNHCLKEGIKFLVIPYNCEIKIDSLSRGGNI